MEVNTFAIVRVMSIRIDWVSMLAMERLPGLLARHRRTADVIGCRLQKPVCILFAETISFVCKYTAIFLIERPQHPGCRLVLEGLHESWQGLFRTCFPARIAPMLTHRAIDARSNRHRLWAF
jgi:hypothetical protein